MRQLNQYICQYCNNAKILQTCYFGYFGHDQPCPPKFIIPTCRKVWYLSVCQKSTSSLPSFLRYCNDIANLLFWVLWACLAMATKNVDINLQKNLMFIIMRKIKYITHLFLEILLRYCKLVILGTLGMPSNAHQTL